MSTIEIISYSTVCILYLALCLLLVTSWRGRLTGGALIMACLISAVWAGILAFQAYSNAVPAIAIFFAETTRSAAWLIFLVVLTSQLGLPRLVQIFVHLIWIVTLLAGLLIWTGTLGSLSLGDVLLPGELLLALSGLILIEQLYRNTPSDTKADIKLLSLGLGGIFAYDLFLYSQGVLFDVLDTTSWAGRGIVNALLVPLIAVSAQRNPRWSVDIFVSRQAVFYTTTLLGVGLYLLLMSLGGYYIVLFGGTWSRLLQLVFFFGAMLVLLSLLFSSNLRARLQVFLVKHFFRNRYDYREEWLRLIKTLSKTEGADTGEKLIKSLAQMVASPGGLLWSVSSTDPCFRLISAHRTTAGAPDIPLVEPLVEFMKERRWLVDMQEYRQKKGHYGDLIIPGWLRAIDKAWLVIPLFFGDKLTGIMVLLEPKTITELNYEDRDLLKTAGQHVAVHLAQEETDSLLSEARQFETYNRLTAFLMHDLKNLIAQQSLIVRNAERHKRNPEFVDDAMETIANSVQRMHKIILQLGRGEEGGVPRKIALKYVVSNAVDRCDGYRPEPKISLETPDVDVVADPDRFSTVLQHLIRNAQDATDSDGDISIVVARQGDTASVSVRDTGSGMTQAFVRDRLFKPFDSTKGTQGMGMGAYQAREFARSMGGDVSVSSAPDEGTTVVVSVPAA